MKNEQNELWDYLITEYVATKDELILICKINGTSLGTLESVLWARVGYRSLEQVLAMEN